MEYFQKIIDGGPVLFAIVLCSLIATFIFIEKWFQFHRAQVNVRELVNGLINTLRRDGMIEAITLCDHTPGPVARILTAAIQAYQNDDEVKPSIEEASMTELPRLESHLKILATIAHIAPLLGLLGTVVGMADVFQKINQKQMFSMSVSDISNGIYTALIATAAGLCVAILAHIGYNYLVSKVESFCVDMEKASAEILYFFNHHKKERRGDDGKRKSDPDSDKA